MNSIENDSNILKCKLNMAKYIVAPMVDRSELSWRLLCRRHGAHLCYTPMFHAALFLKDYKYRRENFVTCPEDRPLIVQFCANDPGTFVGAAKLVESQCDAVDLNLGCPQIIAKKGHYGAFLQDEWQLIKSIVTKAHQELSVPVTCKIRIFSDVNKTIQYAQMLENAGCQLLTVHGRVREQKGPVTGVASWDHIRAVKASVSIPVLANGNVQYFHDVLRCLKDTNVDGVMSAEGILHNPFLFSGENPTVWDVALEFLDLARQYPSHLSFARGHLFKIFHHCLVIPEFGELREQLAKGNSLEEFVAVTRRIREKCLEMAEVLNQQCILPFVPWICQPYIRPVSHPENNQVAPKVLSTNKRLLENLENTEQLSKKKLKRLLKCRDPKPITENPKGKKFDPCLNNCPNPRGAKCNFELCKVCCKDKSFYNCLDCLGHKFYFKTRSEQQPKVQPSL